MIYRIGNKYAGKFENGIFAKTVLASRHMLRQPKGWAIDMTIIEDLVKKDCKFIQIQDKETGLEYQVEFGQFLLQHIVIDRGFGRQALLPLNQWDIILKQGGR